MAQFGNLKLKDSTALSKLSKCLKTKKSSTLRCLKSKDGAEVSDVVGATYAYQ